MSSSYFIIGILTPGHRPPHPGLFTPVSQSNMMMSGFYTAENQRPTAPYNG